MINNCNPYINHACACKVGIFKITSSEQSDMHTHKMGGRMLSISVAAIATVLLISTLWVRTLCCGRFYFHRFFDLWGLGLLAAT